MSEDQFDEFVKQRSEDAQRSSTSFEPAQRIKTWRNDLDALYTEIQRHLQKYIDEEQIKIERLTSSISEELLGPYEVDTLLISIGEDKMKVVPIGTHVIGARGRVDLIGKEGRVRIVLLEEGGPHISTSISIGGEPVEEPKTRRIYSGDIDHRGWYIVSEPPHVSATAISEDSLKDALMEVSGG